MKERLFLFLRYYFYWLLIFVIQKPIFMLYNLNSANNISWKDGWNVICHGFSLDLSTASYLSLFVGLILALSFRLRNHFTQKIITFYHVIILFLLTTLFIADIVLYSFWGFHIDNTVFFYLSTPKEAVASVSLSFILLSVLSILILFVIEYYLFDLWIIRSVYSFSSGRWKEILLLLFYTALLFIPIRGGFSVSTMNTGRVYFSDNMYLNHAAINSTFNFIQSLFGHKISAKRYTYMEDKKAISLCDSLLSKSKIEDSDSLLIVQCPNIILVVLESFSSCIVAPLGGVPDVAPNLNRFCEEGILFTNVYANSFRTDRGLVSVMSSYPAQPTNSIMKYPSKSQTLPFFSKKLKEKGYYLKFYYGGDENFTNMRSYLLSAGFEDRISDKDFPFQERTSKWGAHDHLVFQKLREDLKQSPQQPFLKTVLTLSSHEPFDVPVIQKFKDPYLNSIAYSDSCLGAFINDFKKSPLWKQTLIILVPDHAMRYPANISNHLPARYQIPLLWLGGAIKEPRRIDRLASQIDLVPTLFAQMHIPFDEYYFGKNILAKEYQPFAFYSFNDGFGFISSDGKIVFDCQANKILLSEGEKSELLNRGKAFLQVLYKDLENR